MRWLAFAPGLVALFAFWLASLVWTAPGGWPWRSDGVTFVFFALLGTIMAVFAVGIARDFK